MVRKKGALYAALLVGKEEVAQPDRSDMNKAKPASTVDTALFAGIIVLAIALLMILFVYAFNNSRPGIYLDDENSSQAGPPSSFSSPAAEFPVSMHQVDHPVPTKHAQSILPL
ncbi:hypothetical protein K450DRAFT_267547 [Umbelopsis ramanniana AG]|uniref:Uncharacterized protein n=1 Tax=Umbelopsis ramanniana AG TaxID=1314678 RepID=A0AAD5EJL1_UMBRA|nr:uncharacterized protein K450DRAFT_267547 [Umbelopsis ramanniana AG]KAI8584171.1 hypothetical protein K450DRAFT_267547 [Umbelopsis ramanniana AG]